MAASSQATSDSEVDILIMESEFSCSICSELFIEATTLVCSHTFCKYCINEWRKTNQICPVCRIPFTIQTPTSVVDNYINKRMEMASEEARKVREQVLKQRRLQTEAAAATANANPTVSNDGNGLQNASLTILEDDEEYGDWLDVSNNEESYSDEEDYDDEEEYYEDDHQGNGLPGTYYGGYGRCFYCNQSGHWRNGCPFRVRN